AAPPARAAAAGPVEITSDSATVGVGGKGTLHGNVGATQGDRQIRSEEMEYDRTQGTVRTNQHIDYQDPLAHVTGAGGSYNAATGASFRQAQFSLAQRSARGTAQDMTLTPQGVLDLKGVTFTTCPVNDTSWQLKAKEITLDTRTNIGTGRDAHIDFLGVPIMYLPWVSFPLSSDRKSGFLFPTIANTSTVGAELSVPYYWNIAPNADFTFVPTEYTRRGIDLG